jgi:hypothetical protein
MAAITAVYADALAHVVNAPEPLLLSSAQAVCSDFCLRTQVCQITLVTDVAAGTSIYTFAPGTDLAVSQFRRVWVYGDEVFRASPQQVNVPEAYQGTGQPGRPGFYLDVSGNTMRLYPPPSSNATGGLVVRVSVYPVATATTVPDELAAEWKETILAGIRARIKNIPRQVWSGDATLDMALYERGVRQATVRANAGNVRGPLRVMSTGTFVRGFQASN